MIATSILLLADLQQEPSISMIIVS